VREDKEHRIIEDATAMMDDGNNGGENIIICEQLRTEIYQQACGFRSSKRGIATHGCLGASSQSEPTSLPPMPKLCRELSLFIENARTNVHVITTEAKL